MGGGRILYYKCEKSGLSKPLSLGHSTETEGKQMLQWFKDNIFNEVGRKIQNYAIITLIIDIIACIILAMIALGSSDGWLISLIILACGLGYALIFAMPIYAFGQLVEDVHKTSINTTNTATADTDELPEL